MYHVKSLPVQLHMSLPRHQYSYWADRTLACNRPLEALEPWSVGWSWLSPSRTSNIGRWPEYPPWPGSSSRSATCAFQGHVLGFLMDHRIMQHAWESCLVTSGAVAVENDVGALEPLLANRQPFGLANGTWARCVWLTGLRTESEENKAFRLATRHDSQPLLPLHVLGRGARVLDWYPTLVKYVASSTSTSSHFLECLKVMVFCLLST